MKAMMREALVWMGMIAVTVLCFLLLLSSCVATLDVQRRSAAIEAGDVRDVISMYDITMEGLTEYLKAVQAENAERVKFRRITVILEE